MKSILPALLFCLAGFTAVARYGVVPFNGIVYHEQGISTKRISAELDGKTWIGRYLPQTGSLEVILEEPVGFKVAADGNYHPDADMVVVKKGGDTLGALRNMYSRNGMDGIPGFSLKKLKMTVSFDELAVPGDTYTVYMTVRDTEGGSTARLDLHFEAIIVKKGRQPVPGTANTYGASGTAGYAAMANTDMNLSAIQGRIDSTPTEIKAIMRFEKLQNITTAEQRRGKSFYYLYDAAGNMLYSESPKGADTVLEPRYVAVPAGTTPAGIHLLTIFPLRAEGRSLPGRFIRYRWESADGKKILDGVYDFR